MVVDEDFVAGPRRRFLAYDLMALGGAPLTDRPWKVLWGYCTWAGLPSAAGPAAASCSPGRRGAAGVEVRPVDPSSSWFPATATAHPAPRTS
jgi:hypothetical protein